MDGARSSAAQRKLPATVETITLSYAESARHLSSSVRKIFDENRLQYHVDEKLSDPGERPGENTIRHLEASQLLCMIVSRRCVQTGWHDAEAAYALARNMPVLVFVEDIQAGWQGSAVPTLVTPRVTAIQAFVSRSQPDSATLWEFGKLFFTDRSTAGLFRRAAANAWRWDRATEDAHGAANLSPAFELSMIDDSSTATAEVRTVQATVENGCPVLLLGTSDWQRYRVAYSPDVRAALPAPVFPGAAVIGFMHADFDSGREWPRAGEAPVELRLLGREVYGWHMSEYFWRAFVGSLPKMLGSAGSETPE